MYASLRHTHRHIGIRVKGALIAAIYNKALSVDLTASKEGVGKLNNLMSVDVSVSCGGWEGLCWLPDWAVECAQCVDK